MTNFNFKAEDGTLIHCKKWSVDKPKGIVQIVHGMAEYVARYDEFARYLNDQGYLVAGEDHRGHGETAGSLENTGYFADKDGWNKVIADNVQLGRQLRDEYKDIPFYLFAHSMGSFLSRKIIAEYPEGIDKVIFSGSGDFTSGTVSLLTMIAKIQKLFLGGHAKAKLLDKLSFSAMNNQFNPGRTGFEWISRDEKKVDEYVADPYCGFVVSIQFYIDFASGLKYLMHPAHYEKTPAELPILFYSGEEDPVGGNTKLIRGVYKKYIDSGHSKTELMFNKEGHHESLNEINRQEVYKILTDWLEK